MKHAVKHSHFVAIFRVPTQCAGGLGKACP